MMRNRLARRYALVVLVVLGAAAAACAGMGEPPATGTRTYRLGFSAIPPRPTIQSALETIEAWRSHADIALITQTVPWRALLADTSAVFLVQRDVQQLAALYKSRGFPVIIQVDVTDGLAREREAPELVELGRSITEPAVQARYVEYLLALDSITRPAYLGLAMETNLVRAIAPAGVYAAVRTMANAGAAALAARASTARRFISVQVETAWGRLPVTGRYEGIDTDRADFPFMEALGLSSYPFLANFGQPEQVPLDYFARLNAGAARALPMLVVEGGWTSASVPGVTSSTDVQARWIRRQFAIADSARLAALTQITFTDLDLKEIPLPPNSILPLFAHIGLVDIRFRPKPALAEWDAALARRLQAD